MSAAIQAVDVVGVGLNATDTLIRLPHFPVFDSKLELLSADVRPGGQVASAVVACQKWGLRTRYIGKVGDDPAGQLQKEEFSRTGVEAHLVRVRKCTSQIAFILVDQVSGERTILWKRDARLTIRPEELKREWVQRAKILLVDGHDTQAAAEAARLAHVAGIPVVADLDRAYPRVKVLLKYVDYLLSSKDFPASVTGERDLLKSLPQILREYGCKVVGVTLGRLGALAWDGSGFLYCRGYRVRSVDTTGAGDIFHGGFVYGVSQGWPLARVLKFSCAAAALNCTALGARGGIAPLPEIEALIESGSRSQAAYQPQRLGAHHQTV